MIPTWWQAVVLGLGLFRTLRLVGWDTFPPLEIARAWLLGEHLVTRGTVAQRMGLTGEEPDVEVRYRRAWLAELVHCPFCLGLWLAGLEYALWLEWPRPTLYGAFPLALSGAAGLVAKNLDP